MNGAVEKSLKKIGITISKPILAVICIVFGIVIILWPQLVGLLIGIFLVLEGGYIARGTCRITKATENKVVTFTFNLFVRETPSRSLLGHVHFTT